jgi:hypothetical protein
VSLRWYASRLRAMSVAEAGHRAYRATHGLVRQIRGYPAPAGAMRTHIARWQGPEPFYSARDLTAPLSPALVDEADRICRGQRRVLGLGWLDIPEGGWHYEPRARGYWPRVAATRVVRAAPSHFDPRLTWELSRGHDWVALARAHASTRDRRYLERLVRDVASWRRENPIGVGINWASAMEAAIRIHSLVWCAGLLRGTALVPRLAEMIHAHAIAVSEQLSYFSSANNHLVVELSALIVAARALGGDLARLHAPALARLCSEVERQVFGDGVDAEMATHYHVFVLEALVLVAQLERAHGVPSAALEAAIARMADYLAAIRCDDGSLLQQGDDDGGCVLGLFRPRHAEQVLAATLAVQPAPSRPARSRWFARSGQVILRSRRLHAAFDAGPFGLGRLAAHAHCDALSITLAVDGRRTLVDRGTYRYSGDAGQRDAYRRTAAHNTLQVGSLEQAAAAGPFLWSRHPRVTIHRCDLSEHGDIVQASHDGFPGWRHRRTLVRHGDVLVIADELLGGGDCERVVARYHFAPELAVERVGSRFWASTRAWLISNARAHRVVVSAHSDEYAHSTTAATIELADTSDRALITAIAPADVDAKQALDALARFAADRGAPLAELREVAVERAQ